MRLRRRLRKNRSHELARMLVALDRAAGEVRPLPARKTRVSIAK